MPLYETQAGQLLLWCGAACYAAACGAQLRADLRHAPRAPLLPPLLAAGALCFGLAIGERWLRLGYGPFLTLFEVLLSNLFSLGLVYGLLYWRVPSIRAGARIALPILVVMAAWALSSPQDASHLPATFRNPWLWVHVSMGKLFLPICLVSASLAGLLLARRTATEAARGEPVTPSPELLDRTAWRFLALAFVFHSLMLISGAVWAQDAWGRYWAWDPLETWAFTTWLVTAIALHARVTFHLPARLGHAMMISVFVLAFLTFFGVPFLSVAPHKGAM